MIYGAYDLVPKGGDGIVTVLVPLVIRVTKRMGPGPYPPED